MYDVFVGNIVQIFDQSAQRIAVSGDYQPFAVLIFDIIGTILGDGYGKANFAFSVFLRGGNRTQIVV